MEMNDRITLVKKDGRQFPEIRADVQAKRIFIDGEPELPVEEGDRFTHKQRNGILVSYLVTLATLYDDDWEIEVEKEAPIGAPPPPEKPKSRVGF